MIIEVPYGQHGKISVDLPEDRLAGVLKPGRVDIGNEYETIRRAVDYPTGSPSFADFLSDARNVLILVNDATRPTPTSRVLDVLAGDLDGREVSFLVATGNHRAPSREEYRRIFGGHLERFRDRIFAHDAKKKDDMVLLGKSANGTEIRVNRLAVEAHKILIISSVEPHYFAGYTGGRKSFLPGIAGHDTITQNHKLAMRPEARALKLEGNPVHQDMIDALSTIKTEIFAINTVLDSRRRIYAALAGDIQASFEKAASKADEVFTVPIEAKADIVVSVIESPGDINFYQSHKGIQNAKHALKQGGILILVSSCREGIGETNFFELFGSVGSPDEVFAKIEKGYLLSYHIAAKLAEIERWAKIWAVTDLEPGLLEKIFIRSCGSLQQAVDDAFREKGESARVLFLLDGGLIVPRLRASA